MSGGPSRIRGQKKFTKRNGGDLRFMLFMIAGESQGSGKSRDRGRATNKFISQANQLLFYFKMNEHMNGLI
jgi:hypothetical protein